MVHIRRIADLCVMLALLQETIGDCYMVAGGLIFTDAQGFKTVLQSQVGSGSHPNCVYVLPDSTRECPVALTVDCGDVRGAPEYHVQPVGLHGAGGKHIHLQQVPARETECCCFCCQLLCRLIRCMHTARLRLHWQCWRQLLTWSCLTPAYQCGYAWAYIAGEKRS
jgi:hypothetical protein